MHLFTLSLILTLSTGATVTVPSETFSSLNLCYERAALNIDTLRAVYTNQVQSILINCKETTI